MRIQQPIHSRRVFLKRCSGAAIAFMAVPGLLAACGGQGEGDAQSVAACDEDVSMVDNAMRKALSYESPSPHADKICANCRFYKANEGSACGGCEIVSGPIAPQAYCSSWVALDAG